MDWLRRALFLTAAVALALGSPAAAEERVLVALGDSLTAGHGLSPAESYPSLLQARLRAEGYPYRVVNAGVSGDTTAGALRRVDWVLRSRPDVVIVVIGANDGLRGQNLAAARANLDELVARLQGAGARVLIGGMRLPPNYGGPYATEFERLYAEVARQRGAALMPFFLDGVGAVPALNQPDGIHPTAEGYRIIVERVWPYVRPLLSR